MGGGKLATPFKIVRVQGTISRACLSGTCLPKVEAGLTLYCVVYL
ncbi:hypothetical protein BMS3Abin09_01099 [bacterium BMS3Abin09]|nr:hypothetical protein BMS3Abin09_01099 [bacterium BMS3Abin09]GBE40942.1 hypothetical protein BMS3Bbin09_00829 [bacterium BMS3Bbin09]